VSEQFLNGTSAHYRLFSATNGGQFERNDSLLAITTTTRKLFVTSAY